MNNFAFSTLDVDERGDVQIPVKDRVTSNKPSFVIYRMSCDVSNSIQHQPTNIGGFERQLSLLDPSTDRVSTILVWQHLTVTSREPSRREFFKKVRTCNRYVPKRKCLLNNVSGAIIGGLWAVMGKSSFLSL